MSSFSMHVFLSLGHRNARNGRLAH